MLYTSKKRQDGTTPVPRPQPLHLPTGYFVLQRGRGQYVAVRETEPGVYRAIGNIRTRRNLAAQDAYRHRALQADQAEQA